MTKINRRAFGGLAGGALAALAAPRAFAQQFPNKFIRIVSPAPPGGGTDIIARGVQPHLQALLGQPVIVENKGGGGGYLGVEYTSKSPADGYTLCVSGAFAIITASLHKVPGYDPRKDIKPLAVVGSVPNMLVAGKTVKANNVAELIAYAKTNPSKVNMGSNGVGTSIHLTGELFQLRTGTKFTHIAYRGWADCMAALSTGEVDIMFDNASTSIPKIRAGNIRGFAICGPQRHRDLPDVPTLAELGIKDADVNSWFGLILPANVPADIVATLDKAIGEIMQKAEFRKSIQDQGLDMTYAPAREAGELWIKEVDKWQAVIKAADIKAE
jgi:tripartite-type tricarboxylate transporter receptor subunit TctC